MVGLFKNIVTFGAAGRVESKIEEYEDYFEGYQAKFRQMERERIETNELLEHLVKTKVQSIKSLNKITKISKALESKERDALVRKVGNNFQNVDFSQISNTLTVGQAAISATKGLATGVSTAAGAWALVSTFGAASTGTAIGTLSGVAATNATLAWFGGGAVAAGGAGVAGGALALGGLVAVPALVLTGVFSHIKANKQIAKIEKQIYQIIDTINMIESNLLQLKLTYNRAEEIDVALVKAREVFDTEFKKIYKELYKIPVLSKTWKMIRKSVLRKNYFTADEMMKVAYIGGIAQEFATIIDSKVFDDEGNIVESEYNQYDDYEDYDDDNCFGLFQLFRS